jgi:TPR repeat protein
VKLSEADRKYLSIITEWIQTKQIEPNISKILLNKDGINYPIHLLLENVSNTDSFAEPHYISKCYIEGLDKVEKNEDKGFYYLTIAALRDDKNAMDMLKKYQKEGNQTASVIISILDSIPESNKSFDEKLRVFAELETNKDLAYANFYLGEHYLYKKWREKTSDSNLSWEDGENMYTTKAKEYFEKCIDRKYFDYPHLLSLHYLGRIYCGLHSTAIDIDKSLAEKLWIKGANNGSQECASQLFYSYTKGFGLDQNNEKSIYWARKCAFLGDVDAQLHISSIEASNGNHGDSQKWLNKACENAINNMKYIDAEYILNAYLLSEGSKDGQYKRNVDQLVYFLTEAAKRDHAGAQSLLALLYYEGSDQIGITRDLPVALYWAKKSALNGNTKAQGFLGFLYKDPDFGAFEPIESLAWLIIANKTSEKKHNDITKAIEVISYILKDENDKVMERVDEISNQIREYIKWREVSL